MRSSPILIIEEDDEIRSICVQLLEHEGYKIKSCKTGEEALKLLEEYSEPCLILLDMLMPVMSGREFMAEFAKRPHTIAAIPIYLISASDNSKKEQGFGGLGFLKKPFHADALLSIVKSHCERN